MSRSAVKPVAASSAAITPCMAVLPAVNPFISVPRFFIIPAIADAAWPNAMRVLVDVELQQPRRERGDAQGFLEALIERAAVDELVAPRAEHTFIVCAVISQPTSHANEFATG